MFVQEEKIFAGKVLKIHICTMDGTEWLEEVTEDTTVEKLKEKCLKHVGFSACLCPPSPVAFFVLSFLRPGCFAVYHALCVNCQCRCHQLCIYSNWVDFAIYNLAGWLPLVRL